MYLIYTDLFGLREVARLPKLLLPNMYMKPKKKTKLFGGISCMWQVTLFTPHLKVKVKWTVVIEENLPPKLKASLLLLNESI